MMRLLWVLAAILLIAWVLGLVGVFHLVATLIWVVLAIAIVFAILAFLTGGFLR